MLPVDPTASTNYYNIIYILIGIGSVVGYTISKLISYTKAQVSLDERLQALEDDIKDLKNEMVRLHERLDALILGDK